MWRAKHISKIIQKKCSACVLGSDDDGSEANGRVAGVRLEIIQGSETVAESRNKSPSRSSGTSSSKRSKSMEVETSIVENVGKMSEDLGMISRVLEGDGEGITDERMKSVVKKEVEESLL